MSSPNQTGRVIASYGKEYLVELADASQLRVAANRKAGRAVCGDWVELDPAGLLKSIQARKTQYIRPDFRHRPKVLSANVSTLVWITSHAPPNDELIAARAIMVARLLDLELVFIQSKTDEIPTELPAHLESSHALAQQCDVPWLPVSSKTEDGLAELVPVLQNKSCLVVGQSGVGKSSLVTKLTGDDSIKTQSLSEATGHGRHTTTTASLYKTADGAIELIDAPGMRDIGLWEMSQSELLSALPEIGERSTECRFANCQHKKEPDCAVKQAIDTSEIPPLLYKAYIDASEKGLLS